MGLGTTCLSLLLLLAVHTAYSDYVALAPNNFRPGWEYRVQITVLNTENGNSVTVRGDILNSKGSSVASGTISLGNGETAQLQIPVGPLSSDQGTQYTLKLEGTGGLKFSNTTTIKLEVQTLVTLLQTDKGIYKPGDLVRFRAVTVDSELKPQKLKRTVRVKNPGGSALKKYMDDGSNAVFVNTFQLLEFPDMGEWKIEVESKEHNLKKEFPFKVEEFVLPKFEVTAEIHPNFVVRGSRATKATVKVTAKYTYGKGVLGPIELKIGKTVLRGEITDPKGVGDMIVDIPEDLIKSFADIDIDVNVTDATQRTYGTTVKLQVKDSAVTLDFDKDQSDQVYRSGTPIQVVVKATTADGRPLSPDGPGNSLRVNMTDSSNKNNFRTETFDLGNGRKYFTWKLDGIKSTGYSLDFRAELRYNGKTYTKTHNLQRYKTVGNTTLNARWTSSSMDMWSNAAFAVDVFKAQNFDLSTLRYMVVSRGNVVSNSNANQGGNNQVRITPALCPKADIIVYGLTTVTAASPKPEIIADRLKLDLKGCQEKQVMLRGPGREQRTGSNVTLNLAVSWTEAGKNEMVGEHEMFVLAIDKSITLLQDTNPDLTSDKVDMALETFKLATEGQSGAGPEPLNRGKRSIWLPPNQGSAPASTGELFKEVGMKVLRDVDMKEGYHFGGGDGIIMFAAGAGRPLAEAEMASANEDKKVLPVAASVITTVRKDFPDTWIWTSAKTNNNGQLSMTQQLPDSITSWVVSSFAIRDNTGIAVAAKALEVVAFNPFFVDLNLPYFIRRGEVFILQATVFNYESARMQAMVTLTESKGDFKIVGESAKKVEVIPGTGFGVSFKIEATTIKTITLKVMATGKTIGGQTPARYSDTVIRPLIVKPEGKERIGSETMAVILSQNKTVEEKEITFQFFTKEPIVPGSQRAEVRITGDLMGNAMHDIDKLVSQPMGCGEQNMITTVPNVYAMRYLTAVSETTPKFNRTAKKYMATGYDRELGYRFDDGGYSAFGKSDGNQSTWLTAFVVKSFAQAKLYIPEVDEDILKEDMDYLLSVQTAQGTFTERGRVIHQEMLGGTASQDGTLSVYVTMCLLEASNSGIVVVPERLTRALAFVRGVAKQLIDRAKNGQRKETDMFLAALTAYTLTLSKPVDEAMVMQVMKIAVDSTDAPWKKPPPAQPSPKAMDSHIYPPPKAGASAVETTSYCILAYVGLGKLVEAQNLTKWMTTQQNNLGGYGSTQDTMMALQATSEFAAKSSAFMARSTVTITPLEPPGQPITIPITTNNRRLLQIQSLPDTVSKVKVRVEGDPNSLSVVKLNWYYYTNPDPTPKDVTTDTKTKFIREKEFEFTSCMRLRDGFQHNQMMVMEVEPPSGFALDNRIEAKKDNPCARRVEVNPQNNVIFYFDQAENCCVKYKMSQEDEVDNLKPGNSILYSYYNADGIRAESKVSVECLRNCPKEPTGHAAPMASMSGLLLTACICLLLSLIVAM